MPFGTRRPRLERGPEPKGKNMSDQAAKAHTDVRAIVARYTASGRLDHLAETEPRYGDFSAPVDLEQAMRITRDAEQRFRELPAHVKRACGQDPVEFLRKLSTREGVAELAEAGLPIRAVEPPDPFPTPPASLEPASPKGTPPAEAEPKTAEPPADPSPVSE